MSQKRSIANPTPAQNCPKTCLLLNPFFYFNFNPHFGIFSYASANLSNNFKWFNLWDEEKKCSDDSGDGSILRKTNRWYYFKQPYLGLSLKLRTPICASKKPIKFDYNDNLFSKLWGKYTICKGSQYFVVDLNRIGSWFLVNLNHRIMLVMILFTN